MGIFDKGLNGIGSLVGLGGGQGEYYQAQQLNNDGTKGLGALLKAKDSAATSKARDKLLNGGSLADALKGDLTYDDLTQLGSGALTGNIIASQQARNDPMMKGLIGEGGSLDNALSEEKNLANRGYSLQPEDYEAYGQASGNIARMFGTQENGLAQSLANRGLSAAPSGQAAKQFSGLMGNKNEQLGQMQRQIADDRMSKNLARLTQTRSYINQLGGLGQNAENSAFSHNQQAYTNTENTANNLASAQRGDYTAQGNANQASMQSKLDNQKMGLSDAVSGGLFSGVQGGLSGGASKGVSSLFRKDASKGGGAAAASGDGSLDMASIAKMAAMA